MLILLKQALGSIPDTINTYVAIVIRNTTDFIILNAYALVLYLLSSSASGDSYVSGWKILSKSASQPGNTGSAKSVDSHRIYKGCLLKLILYQLKEQFLPDSLICLFNRQ